MTKPFSTCGVQRVYGKNTMYSVGMEGHATLQMSALPYFAGIAFFKL